MLYQIHLAKIRFKLRTLVVIATDCIGSYKSTTVSYKRPPFYTINDHLSYNIQCHKNYNNIKTISNWTTYAYTEAYDVCFHIF